MSRINIKRIMAVLNSVFRNLIAGAATLIFIPPPRKRERELTEEEALYGDWEHVGRDLSSAMETFNSRRMD